MKSIELKRIEALTLSLAQYLRELLPLANKHNCDFITDKLWENCVPPGMASQLMDMSVEKLVQMPSGRLQGGAHTDGAVTRAHDERPGDQLSLTMTKSLRLCHNISGQKAEWDKSLNTAWVHKELGTFVRTAHSQTLPELGVLSSLSDALSDLATEEENIQRSVHVSHGMGDKKSHEIEIMADACGNLANTFGISHVIDIGSGRGYLGCQLALLYKLRVLGVDSSCSNTHSAATRTTKLNKLWPSLVKQSVERANNPDMKPVGRRQRRRKRLHGSQEKVTAERNSDICVEGAEKSVESGKERICETDVKSEVSSNLYIPVTDFVSEETDLGLLVRTHFYSQDEQKSNSSCELNSIAMSDKNKLHHETNDCFTKDNSEDSVLPQEHNCDSEKICDKLLTENICDDQKCEKRSDILLTGLHTCGDLAGSVLRLYTANPDVKLVCTVGCCYHLISERFLSTPMDPPEGSVEPSFPQSSVLKSRGYQLGRNARMLACQSADRMAHKLNPDADKWLHWRAVLQEILRDITGEKRDDWRIGRIAVKCKTFTEYVYKAMDKLEIQHSLTDDDIAEYESRYSDYEHKMAAFFYLKAVLAPCIEALLLLDRLCYVLEQDCTVKAHIVQLFDPVTSPRCYAIIASKI